MDEVSKTKQTNTFVFTSISNINIPNVHQSTVLV